MSPAALCLLLLSRGCLRWRTSFPSRLQTPSHSPGVTAKNLSNKFNVFLQVEEYDHGWSLSPLKCEVTGNSRVIHVSFCLHRGDGVLDVCAWSKTWGNGQWHYTVSPWEGFWSRNCSHPHIQTAGKDYFIFHASKSSLSRAKNGSNLNPDSYNLNGEQYRRRFFFFLEIALTLSMYVSALHQLVGTGDR